MAKPRLTPPPALQCYDCHCTGDCCRGYFQVQVTEDEQQRILGQGWSERSGFAGRPLFRGRPGQEVLAHRDDGACIFLNAEGLCSIHAEFGEEAKPLACRMYPFVLVPAGDEVRVDVRFDCPSVAASKGRALPEHQDALRRMRKEAAPDTATGRAVLIAPGREGDWKLARRLAALFDQVIADISLDLTRRVLACAWLGAHLRDAPFEALSPRECEAYLDAARRGVVESVAGQEPMVGATPPRLVRVPFRQLAALYGRADRAGERARPAGRLAAAVRMVLAAGTLPALRPELPAASFREVEAMAGGLSQAASAAFTRYYRVRLASMGFFGPGYYGEPLLSGLAGLWLTYPLLLYFARWHAAGLGDSAIGVDSARLALRIVDHHHGRNPWLNTPSERRRRHFLGDPHHFRQLLQWLGFGG